MINPTNTLAIAKIRTLPAARSFAALASGFLSCVTRSTTRSTALFIASAAQTAPTVKNKTQASPALTFSSNAATATTTVKNKWILVLLSWTQSSLSPAKEYLKDETFFFKNSEIKIFSRPAVQVNTAFFQIHILIFPHLFFLIIIHMIITE